MGNKTIELCDRIVDQIEARREIDQWLRQARLEAERELAGRQLARAAAEGVRRRQGWFALRSVKAGGL